MKTRLSKQSREAKPARSSTKPRKPKPVTPAPRDELFDSLRSELGL